MKSKLVGIIILILLFNAIVPNFTQATDVEFDVNHEDFDNVTNSYTKGAFETLKDQGKATLRGRNGNKTKKTEGTLSFGSTLTAAIAGIFYPPAILCSTLMTIISRGNEVIDINSRSKVNWYTIEDTVFNKIDMFDSNYFVQDQNDENFNGKIKDSVALFYNVTRTIALICGLLMLIYVGIRMALSTIASETAKYKNMLKDWVVSMILIFALPYIIALIGTVSDALVEIFAKIAPESFEQTLLLQTFNLLDITSGWSYTAVMLMYLVLTFYQIKFFLMYINRMLSIGFLIIISPLITVTYSATKTPISGSKGGTPIFSKWLKEFTITTFIQPLHAALYMVFVSSAYEIFTVAPLLAVLFFMGLSRAEKIVKNIFGMRNMASINSMSAYMPFKRKG